jgi:Domain of unknown function (DUF4214)/Peptidase M10 serralysin C terminal/Putative Ig domain
MTTPSGINAIDALVFSSWNVGYNTPATVTYSFLTEIPPGATSEDSFGFAPMSNAQRQEVRLALAQWASFANLTFVEIEGDGGNTGQIRFGTNNQQNQSAGYSDLPSNDPRVPVYTYLDNQPGSASDFRAGSYDRTVFLHEVGHALGLKHPGNYNGDTGSGTPPFLPSEIDNSNYTLMSYNDGNSARDFFRFPATPLLLDIQAIQFIYGANTSWHTGNDVYQFFNNDAPMAIWDAGGSNTFDFSATTGGATIDLRAGTFSETAPGLNNVAIAYNVAINTAIGGSGDDNIRANSAGNSLTGHDGNDFFYLGSGRDTVDGGNGADKVILPGLSTDFQISRSGSGFVVQNRSISNDIDTIRNVEYFVFSDNVEIQASSFGVNRAPIVASPLKDVYAGVGKAFNLQAGSAFSDPDVGDVLRFTALQTNGSALPGWLQFNGNTGSFSGTPGAGQTGNVSVNVSAIDGSSRSVSDSFTISTIANYGTQFTNTTGADRFTGSSAVDNAIYNGNRADFTIRSATGTGINLNSSYTVSRNGVTDTLVGVDRLQFADATVALDISGHGGQAYGLYQAVFRRTPDLDGLGFWINALDKGASMLDVTRTFISSPEFVSTYSTLNNADFVNLVYVNVLGRNPDAGGAQHWTSGLNANLIDRGVMMLDFVKSPEFQGNLAASVGNGFAYHPFLG